MRIAESSIALLREFAPQLERTSLAARIWIAFLVLLILFGGVGLYFQVKYGHAVTGMRDHVVWGIYIANFIFFIGISYAGAVISGILHLLKVEWRKPFIRLAELITVIATIVGPVFILLCVGRLDRLHHLIIYPRLQSPITWDVLAISTYLVGSILLLYLALIRDFAIYRDTDVLKVAKWKRKLYRILALGYQDLPRQRLRIKTSIDLLAVMIIPLAIVVHSVLSWIFGMTLRPGWHSTIFGPYFVMAAIYSGTGVLIIAMWIFRRIYNLQEYITEKHFTYVGYMLLALAAGYGYFTFSEYLTSWYGSEHWESQVLDKLFSFSEYGAAFLFANVAGIILPIIVVAVRRLRKPGYLALVSAIMVLALWVKRYLIIVPTLESPLIPMQETRPEYVDYAITWVEWSLTLGGLATFLLLFTLASKFVTVVPVSEILKKP
ncbi:MAG: NrfD/PsrC family molybdoenzyme membrane anchor subunit [Saprospiraceae bacterium]|nr:NrfD/PsrC family molybdoenzyme membrane anchor subunit [Saprospiraceae bacterium]